MHYYPFAVNLNRCVGSCNTLNDFSNEVCVPNKAEDLNVSVFNTITEINESKTLGKHTSCECKYKFVGRKCNSNQKWNNDKCGCECKKHSICQKECGILLYVVAKIVNILQVLMTIQWLHVMKL